MPHEINLDALSEAELAALNRQIVERIRLLRKRRCLQDMLSFHVGDTVSFTVEGGRIISGRVTKLNQKTITVVSDDDSRWRVSPALLSKTTDAAGSGPAFAGMTGY